MNYFIKLLIILASSFLSYSSFACDSLTDKSCQIPPFVDFSFTNSPKTPFLFKFDVSPTYTGTTLPTGENNRFDLDCSIDFGDSQ